MPAVELEYLVVMLIVVLTMATMPILVNTQTLGNDTDCLIGLQYGWKGNSLWNNLPNTPICTTPSSSSLTGIACNNNRILSITLSSFNLSGTISPSLANCTFLQSLDLSSNNLYDSIPSNIGNLSYLTSLNFSHNHLSTPIPPQLSACAYLNVLDLHLNLLSGPIPAQLGLLQRLKVFDVSYNQLSGYIPTTLSNTSTGAPRFNASSFVGNNDLYGYPLPPATSHSLSVLAIVGIGLASGLVSLIVSFTAVCIWLRVTEQGFAAEEGKISQLMSES